MITNPLINHLSPSCPHITLWLISLPAAERKSETPLLTADGIDSVLAPDAVESLLADCQHWLSEDEQARVDRLHLPAMQLRQRIIRLCVRATLSLSLGISPSALCFAKGLYGKPSLDRSQMGNRLSNVPTDMDFNISHSGDKLVVGVIHSLPSQYQWHFGVDIERLRSNTDIAAIYRHYFSAPEQTLLETLEGEAQRRAFFDLWALKESFIKATGRGLGEDLKSFAFGLDRASFVTEAPLVAQASLVTEASPWRELTLQFLSSPKGGGSWHHLDWCSSLLRMDNDYRLAVTLGLKALQCAVHADDQDAPRLSLHGAMEMKSMSVADLLNATLFSEPS